MINNKPFIIACIPAYNEEKTIAKVIIKTQKYVDKVMVCDDGSKDMTSEIAERLGAIVIKHERNMGKGEALNSLFKKAIELNADIVITLDGDGQHNPDEIPFLIKPILENKADIVNGSRFLKETEMPTYRKIGNKILNAIINLKMEQKITDTQSGFRAYSKKVLEIMEITEKNIGVDSQILLDASKEKLRIVELPISVTYHEVHSTYNPIKHFAEVLNTLLKRIIEENPFLYLALPGFTLILIGIIAGIRVIEIFIKMKALAIGTALVSIASIIIGILLLITFIILRAIKFVSKK